MDNKQKKKLYKRIYKTMLLFSLVFVFFAIYVSGNALHKNQTLYEWLHVTIIIIQLVFAFMLLYDGYITKKLKNKYLLGNCLYFVVFASIVGFCCVWGLEFFNQIILIQSNIVSLSLVIINAILLVVVYNLGLVISKLYQNTTITIDSVSETPNYDDELLLKKKLDELNRKLEIKKVQEQIDKVEKELDNK